MAPSGSRRAAVDPTRRARLERDAALERVGRLTRGITVGSVVAAGAFGLYVAHALPGHAASTSTGGAVSGGAVSGGAVSGGAVSGGAVSGGAVSGGGVPQSGGLSQPAAAPAPSQQPAPVISGAS